MKEKQVYRILFYEKCIFCVYVRKNIWRYLCLFFSLLLDFHVPVVGVAPVCCTDNVLGHTTHQFRRGSHNDGDKTAGGRGGAIDGVRWGTGAHLQSCQLWPTGDFHLIWASACPQSLEPFQKLQRQQRWIRQSYWLSWAMTVSFPRAHLWGSCWKNCHSQYTCFVSALLIFLQSYTLSLTHTHTNTRTHTQLYFPISLFVWGILCSMSDQISSVLIGLVCVCVWVSGLYQCACKYTYMWCQVSY